LVVKRGEVDANSFYTSAVSAGITDSLIPGFLKVFTFDFDFQFEIKEGDIFEAGFEELINSQGEVYGEPKLVYASLTTSKKSKSVYFFEQSSKSLDELGGWYDGNGHSIIRSFMRTPLDGARMRISSNFGFRKHPISGFKKLHKGTDFAAPTGTPVYAASDGNVLFASMKGANGNLVIIEHTNGWLTYYLHLNDFGPGIQAGIGVKQGQRIGDVGTTGRSTGPHLHYEIHINGEAIDPLGIEVDEGKKLSELNQQAFFKERDRIDAIRATSNF
jgi:murein DD-endopeptidase MepM/ murein hydrolase activator NlpD